MFDDTGCDGVAVARGALGNPWIFRDVLFNRVSINKPFSEQNIAFVVHLAYGDPTATKDSLLELE